MILMHGRFFWAAVRRREADGDGGRLERLVLQRPRQSLKSVSVLEKEQSVARTAVDGLLALLH